MSRCGVIQYRCVCILPHGHETPHVCDCGGSYHRVGDRLKVYALPPGDPGYVSLNEEEAISLANRCATEGPIFEEDVDLPFRVPREPIKFFRPPSASR